MSVTEPEMVWVRCNLRRLAPKLGLNRHGDIAQVTAEQAARFDRFVTIVDGPVPLIDLWVDAEPGD